jgi:hypothetical protein
MKHPLFQPWYWIACAISILANGYVIYTQAAMGKIAAGNITALVILVTVLVHFYRKLKRKKKTDGF